MREEIINILNEIRPEFDFGQDLNFIEQGMLDSFDVILLVSKLDEKYGTSIDGLDIVPGNFASVDSIIDLLNKKGIR